MADADNEKLDASEAEKPADALSADALFTKLSGWVKRDWGSEGQTKFRRDAAEDFDFEAGEQLSEEDKSILKEAQRPIVIFNRVGAYIDSVAGQEIGSRQEVQFLPRNQGAVKVNELLTSAAKWFRQQCDAEDEESDAFRDMTVCGMGWTETRLDYEDDPKGQPLIDHMDPLTMGWDRAAKKRNLRDARRVFQVRKIPLAEAKALCPGDPDRPFVDADYNASWINDIGTKTDPHENDGHYYNKESQSEDEDDLDGEVTMVRIQWWERVPAYLTLDPADPSGQKILTLSADEYREREQRYKLAGAQMPKVVKTTRKVYRQAYIGSRLLEVGDSPCKNHFTMKAMTAKRDRKHNVWYGLVRAMKDPARWANKWMSQTMHIMNSTAKGGIAVVKGKFFHNDNQGEESWSKQDATTYLKDGALDATNPKYMLKQPAQFPQSSFELMNFAVSSLGAVTGINLEALGMQQAAGQAASLDLQRKQSVLTILQPLFDSLRRYRKDQGRVLMYIIEYYLADGRLIKIEGPEEAQYVPLIREQAFSGNSEYDVIVDEAPTSANQKEMTWAMLQQILPVVGKMLPPATWLALLKYSPLPTSAQKDISDSMQQAQSQPNPEQQQRDAELNFERAKTQTQVDGHQAITAAKIDGMRQEQQTKRELAFHGAQQDAALKHGEAAQSAAASGQLLQEVIGALGDMRRDMSALAQSVAALADGAGAAAQ